jgi:hypothetical protein
MDFNAIQQQGDFMRVLLKLQDGVEFLTYGGQFVVMRYPEHKHKDTEFMVPEQFVMHCQVGKIRISEDSFRLLVDTLVSKEILFIDAIEDVPEWQLCGYATREEFDAKKSEVLAFNNSKEIEKKNFIEKLRVDRKIAKKNFKDKKVIAKNKKKKNK